MFSLYLLVFLLLLGILVIALLFVENIIIVVLITTLISLFISILFLLLEAVDVAITEAAIGAGITTALSLAIIHLTKSFSLIKEVSSTKYKISFKKKLFYLLLFVSLIYIFLNSLIFIPIFGNFTNPAHNIIYQVYTIESYNTFKVPNVVTMVLGSFRGYDTLGEAAVVFIAAISVYLILQGIIAEKQEKNTALTPEKYNQEFITKAIILSLIPFLFLYGFYIQFHGDFGPGGGFQAGVVVSAPIILLNLFYGSFNAKKFISSKILLKILTIGLMLYTSTGFLTMILGGYFLDYYQFGQEMSHSYHYGLFLIELGVGITVFASMAIIIQEFYKKVN